MKPTLCVGCPRARGRDCPARRPGTRPRPATSSSLPSSRPSWRRQAGAAPAAGAAAPGAAAAPAPATADGARAGATSSTSFSGATTATSVCSAGRRTETPSGLQVLSRDVLAQLEVRDVGFDLHGYAVGQAAYGHQMMHDAKDVALSDTDGLADGSQWDLDIDRAIELHLDEVDVLEQGGGGARDGMNGVVTDHREGATFRRAPA